MNSTIDVIKFTYAGMPHERRGETWFRIQSGQAFEVSYQQGEIIELAYQTSLSKGRPATALTIETPADLPVEVAPEKAECAEQPAAEHAPEVAEAPAIAIEPTVAAPTLSDLKPMDFKRSPSILAPLPIEPPTAGTVYQTLVGQLTEKDAEIAHLREVYEQVVTLAASLVTENEGLEKQIDNLSNRRARTLRQSAKYRESKAIWASIYDSASKARDGFLTEARIAQEELDVVRKGFAQARAQVRTQKQTINELRESLAASRTHVELLQKQVSVQGLIETRTAPEKPEAPKA